MARKIKHLWISGGSPAAVVGQAEDDSLWLLEMQLADIAPPDLKHLHQEHAMSNDAVTYRWRRLPDLPAGEEGGPSAA